MQLTIIHILLFLALGGIASFAAGMFGIGGGIIVIPGLTFIFSSLGFSNEQSIRIAIATSMTNMIFVSFGSLIANHKMKLIVWKVFKLAVFPIILGTVSGLFISNAISGSSLRKIFGGFIAIIALKMIYDSYNKYRNLHPFVKTDFNKIIFFISISLIGIIAGMLGLGAGFAIVPFLIYFCMPIKEATGTSSAISFIVSLTGTIFYLTNKSIGSIDSPYFIGYIFWVGILIMLPTSLLFSHYGAKIKKKMQDKYLSIVFAIILTIVGIKMIFPNIF
jgi:hypothetical protein